MREQEAEAERRRQMEAERQRLMREREAEVERRRQAEAELQRLAAEAREREAERRRQAEAELQRLAREQEAEAERRQRLEQDRLSRRHAATAVGRNEAARSLYAVTFIDQPSATDAESRALSQCAQSATEYKIIARFSGPGKCVFVAAGSTSFREPGRIRRVSGARVAPTEWEALQKCQSAYETCRVFHTRCNSSL